VGAPFGESFSVPKTSPFYPLVERILHRGVTGGCGATAYCPQSPVTREQVAVFTLAGKEGGLYSPQACSSPPFADLPTSSPFCRFVAELARRGVGGGCGSGNYCPADPVTREQMAVCVAVAFFGLDLYGPQAGSTVEKTASAGPRLVDDWSILGR
jgi:hypothetical protein